MSRIIVDKNIVADQKSFTKFIFNHSNVQRWPHVRSGIFDLYPELGTRIALVDSLDDKITQVNQFVEELHTQYESRLDDIITQWNKRFNHAAPIIQSGLSSIMNCVIPDTDYYIHVSLMPGSTYGQNSISLSVVSDIRHQRITPCVDIAIHELSHVIWVQKIGAVYDSLGLVFNPVFHSSDQGYTPITGNSKKYLVHDVAHEDLKEIFAPIVIRCPEFDSIRESEGLKYANTQQQSLNVEYAGKVCSIVDYFDAIFKVERERGTSFDDIMKISTRVIYSLQDSLVQKRSMLSQCITTADYKNIFSQPEYQAPMKIGDGLYSDTPLIIAKLS